jgi:hypothetical protein
MIATDGTKLVQNASFMKAAGTLITTLDGVKIFPFAGQTHIRCLGNHELESTNSQTPRPDPSPGNLYPESTRPTLREGFLFQLLAIL